MAKVIRNQFVYYKQHMYRYLPRPPESGAELWRHFFEAECQPEHFPDKLAEPAPKLWVAWIYKPNLNRTSRKILRDVELLFGKDWRPGKMEVFKNTPSWNSALWRIKHLIEIRPLRFAAGAEPNCEADAARITVDHEGVCRLKTDDGLDPLLNGPDQGALFDRGYMVGKTMGRWHSTGFVHEDELWTDPKISRF